jgi:hypothetical protein
VARAAERIQLTVTRGAVGTPAYMAPEQARDTRQATMASDVFSLGATMLFAATGHAPYQGETVMDVLVRLATEPPDLTGLPDDLAGIVRSCLERDPRKRPSPAAVLAGLAPGIGPEGTGPGLESSALPAPALALIAEYRRDPGPAARANVDASLSPGTSDDPTFDSQPALSAPARAPARRSRRRRIYLAACLAVAAAVLVGAGTAVGFAVASNRPPPPPPPPGTIVVPASQASLSARQAGRPQIAFYQTFGDSHTVFVLHGEGWTPGQVVTVTMSGRVSPVHPVVDGAGTFSYAINQDHEFFRGGLAAGTYHVVITTPDGARAMASFVVRPGSPGASPPPGSPPPAG